MIVQRSNASKVVYLFASIAHEGRHPYLNLTNLTREEAEAQCLSRNVEAMEIVQDDQQNGKNAEYWGPEKIKQSDINTQKWFAHWAQNGNLKVTNRAANSTEANRAFAPYNAAINFLMVQLQSDPESFKYDSNKRINKGSETVLENNGQQKIVKFNGYEITFIHNGVPQVVKVSDDGKTIYQGKIYDSIKEVKFKMGSAEADSVNAAFAEMNAVSGNNGSSAAPALAKNRSLLGSLTAKLSLVVLLGLISVGCMAPGKAGMLPLMVVQQLLLTQQIRRSWISQNPARRKIRLPSLPNGRIFQGLARILEKKTLQIIVICSAPPFCPARIRLMILKISRLL